MEKNERIKCPKCGVEQERIEIDRITILPKKSYSDCESIEVRFSCDNEFCGESLRCNLMFNTNSDSLMTVRDFKNK